MTASTPARPGPSWRLILNQVLQTLALAYGASASAYLLLRTAYGPGFSAIAVINNFGHWLALPALLLLPLALLLRWRLLTVALLLPPLAFFLALYGARFLPQPAHASAVAPAATPVIVTVLTFNIAPNNDRPAAVARVILESGADIVALQELSSASAAALRAALGDAYPYAALHPQGWSNAGQGVFSRYPILEDAYWRYTDITPNAMGHQRVLLDIDGTPLVVYNVHPTHPLMNPVGFDERTRDAEIRETLARAAGEEVRVVLAGDFNTTDLTEIYATIVRRYRDAYAETGWGYGLTFPAWLITPVLRIDYIFAGAGLDAINSHVVPDGAGSDHLPVQAELAIVPG
jgi:vancomycin resistance protein VanJ